MCLTSIGSNKHGLVVAVIGRYIMVVLKFHSRYTRDGQEAGVILRLVCEKIGKMYIPDFHQTIATTGVAQLTMGNTDNS